MTFTQCFSSPPAPHPTPCFHWVVLQEFLPFAAGVSPFPERRLCSIIGGSPDLERFCSFNTMGEPEDALAGSASVSGYGKPTIILWRAEVCSHRTGLCFCLSQPPR